MLNKNFTKETTLQVNIRDAAGNLVNEKSLSKSQINFCAKAATKMYKKFAASTKGFDAEKEEIDITLPEDIETVNIDEMVEDANNVREAAATDDEIVTEVVDDDPIAEEATVEVEDEPSETEMLCGDIKNFAAKLRKFSRRMRRFSEDEVEEVKEMLAEVADAVEDIADEEPAEETVKEFCAKFKKLKKKFAAEDLTELKELQEDLSDAIEELDDKDQNADPDEGDHGDGEGVLDIKNFSAECSKSIEAVFGKDSVANFKAQFFAKK